VATLRLIAAALLALALPVGAQAPPSPGEARLLRYPDIHGNTIAFVYAGDIWLVPVEGGDAHRLTTGAGLELFPKFSPDGKWIAFTGQYSGNNQVYVISVEGGIPQQLTFHNDIGGLAPRAGYDNQVLGWTPDGASILFRAHRVPWSDRLGRPYLVPAHGGMEHPMRVPEGGNGTMSADGSRFAYTVTQTEFRGWKRYKGGQAQDIWIYDFQKDTSERITDYPGTDNQPMWIGNTIYFTSDRDGRLNLYSYDLASKATKQLTHHDRYDVLWPSGHDHIVYENGGWIYLFDRPSGQSHRVPIRLAGDFPQTLPHRKNVKADVQNADLSPSGKRAVVEARGELFTVPAERGEILNLTNTPGIREQAPAWSPDGRSIAYLSDRSGEYEIYVRPSDGGGEERRVTNDGKIWRFPPVWSPDSKHLAFGDSDRKLWVVEVAGGPSVQADSAQDTAAPITDYRWSPDSRYLVYTKPASTRLPQIWIYALEDHKAQALTDGLTNDSSPAFSADGHYLFFLSDRDFNLTFSSFEFDYVYSDPTRIYVGLLAKDGPPLLLPESDEEALTPPPAKGHDDGAAEPAGKDSKSSGKVGHSRVKIDFDGFGQRVRSIPVASGNLHNLTAIPDGLLYVAGRGPRVELREFSFQDRKDQLVLPGVSEYAVSADGKKLLFHKGDTYGIVDAHPGQHVDQGALNFDHLDMQVEPRAEWKEMFDDAWRIERDWFYDPKLHGLNWKAVHDQYAELLPFLADRDDLDFLLSEMGGEISAGHVYVERGDEAAPERVENGLLGAEIVGDPSGYFRIDHIFPGENWADDTRSPLTEPGVHASQGELILAVDGVSTKSVGNFYQLMNGKAGREVKILFGTTPDPSKGHLETVKPVRSEQGLRYIEWVRANRAWVDKASGGKIGYIHLPNTAEAGNRELFKGFYQQATKSALILDDRYNGGGFIPDRMIALLSRPLLNYFVSRDGVAGTTPGFVSTGPKACLINGLAGSGGDAFPYYFRKEGLGPLIGTRTWGGLIGLSGNPVLMDGGSLSTPAFRFLDTSGHWDVEGVGVAPDIEVIDRPDEVAKGHDPSLEKAVAYLLDQLKQHPPTALTVPPPPQQEHH
jgi:tricorn protease